MLCSGTTPWDKLNEFNAGWEMEIIQTDFFAKKIEELINYTDKDYQKLVDGCEDYINFIHGAAINDDNTKLFE